MPYRVVEKITNITNITFNSWEEYEPYIFVHKSLDELSNMFLVTGNELNQPTEILTKLVDFLKVYPRTVSDWDQETQSAIRTVDWPDKETWDLYLDMKPDVFIEYWADVRAEREIISKEEI
jgi:hypothetical protein